MTVAQQSISSLRLEAVERRFGGFKAVAGVTEQFDAGELICIIGPNGAGKSTLLNMICGTLDVSSGTISFGGAPINGRSPEDIARLGIARKFQVPSVFESLSVEENLKLSAPLGQNAAVVEALLEKTHLVGDRHVPGADLPHGKKQWLEIGMALAMQPKVLLLDEPTAGLSVDETRQTARFLKELQGKVTVVVIEHDMAFVRELGARTIVMHNGSIIASGPFHEIETNETVRNVYLGRA